MEKGELERTKEYWAAKADSWKIGSGVHWLEHPEVQKRINLKITMRTDIDKYQYFIDRYMNNKKVERILTLGCGAGEFERGFAQYGVCQVHEAMDISDGAIEKARLYARNEGYTHIHYWVADLNTILLEEARYDVIFGISALHHVRDLDHLFQQIQFSLKPGGYLYFDEYVGPNRFQYPARQIQLVNQTLQQLPEHLRISITHPPQVKLSVRSPTIQEVVELDPSEAVRSEDIVQTTQKYLNIIEQKGYGGSLLHLLLEDIAGNFNPLIPETYKTIQSLFALEDRNIQERNLQDDFAVVIARKNQ